MNSAQPLAPGAYIIVEQANGSISSSGAYAVNGTSIGVGDVGSISVNGGTVTLTSAAVPAMPRWALLTGAIALLAAAVSSLERKAKRIESR